VARGTEVVGVLHGVHGAVEAGTLAVPESEYAVVAGTGEQIELLRAPDDRRRQFLVHCRLEVDVIILEMTGGFPERAVEPAQR